MTYSTSTPKYYYATRANWGIRCVTAKLWLFKSCHLYHVSQTVKFSIRIPLRRLKSTRFRRHILTLLPKMITGECFQWKSIMLCKHALKHQHHWKRITRSEFGTDQGNLNPNWYFQNVSACLNAKIIYECTCTFGIDVKWNKSLV